MITKRKLANNKYSITFSMPAVESISALFIAGDFNAWDPTSTPLTKAKDGSWSVKLTLAGDKNYQYRYRDNNGAWHNDWAPDGYQRNEFGEDNSVLILTADAAEQKPKKVAAKKKKAM